MEGSESKQKGGGWLSFDSADGRDSLLFPGSISHARGCADDGERQRGSVAAAWFTSSEAG